MLLSAWPAECGLVQLICLAACTGVSDIEEAQAGLDFAKRFEIIKGSETKNIKLQAVDLSDESAITSALPRYVCHLCRMCGAPYVPAHSQITLGMLIPDTCS